MPLLHLVPPNQKQKILEAYESALCGDYCLVDNCRKCNETRLEASLPILVEVLVNHLREQWLRMEVLVREEARHPDALQVLTDLLTELGSPPKRKPRI